MKRAVNLTPFIILSTILSMSCQVQDDQSTTASSLTVVKAGLLIDGTGNPPLSDALIFIEGNQITRVAQDEEPPSGANIVDASGQVVMPGLIDTHVHPGDRANAGPSPEYADSVRQHLKQALDFGVTTIFSLGLDTDTNFAIRDQSWEDGFDGARMLTAGRGFTSVGGHPTQLGSDLPRQIDDPALARQQVQELAAQGVDGIKIWVAPIGGLPVIKAEVSRAIIDEAHKNNLRVFAHLNTAEDTQTLVEAQLDGVTHIAWDTYREETIELMQKQGTMVAPMLVQKKKGMVFAENSELFEDPLVRQVLGPEVDELKEALAQTDPEVLEGMTQAYEQGKENVRLLKAAGITLAVGTDSNTNFAPVGLITHTELEALVDAGLSPMEALVAATRGSAEWAGVSDKVGTLEAGKLADMIILEEDPLVDVANTRKIAKVILGGRVVE